MENMKAAFNMKAILDGRVPINNEGLVELVESGQPLSNLDTSKVTHMSLLFLSKKEFNQDISKWDTSNVTAMGGMFCGAHAFNQDISGWDVGKVEDMGSMFMDAKSFNQDISAWDVGNVVRASGMFQDASSFNQNLSNWSWSTERSVYLNYLFRGATALKYAPAWPITPNLETTGMSKGTGYSELLKECVEEGEDSGEREIDLEDVIGETTDKEFEALNAFNLSRTLMELVDKRRKEADWSFTRLAEEIDSSPSYLSQLMSGGKLLNLKTLAKISKALKFSLKVDIETEPLPEHWEQGSYRIAQALKGFMVDRGLSRIKMAELCNVPEKSLCHWLKGTLNISIKSIDKLETATDLDLFSLLRSKKHVGK